ncbi:LOW QUALITY PROTEIN: aquaporin-9-like [Pollicipes pollicipes]|uniref:aquaporin-9-like n=1 Tax=Pollicipes pollicipes TaxID=41117 RepID=UPI0018851A0E|nr:aquaporin-9-like [Pollicipes pollicipes]XP_037073561.1 LOW QUALITY PROTEIN: aquaporin-9-like [Pollicipes pollicipes]
MLTTISWEPVRRACRLRHPIVRETLAELVGTMTLVFIGNSVIANNAVNAMNNEALGYGVALAISVFATGGVSGGHVNPAVTVALSLAGRCQLNRVLPFVLAQYIGGFIGAALTHGLYFDLFKKDPGRYSTLYGIFATYPELNRDFKLQNISLGGAFLDQVMGTALLMYGIMAITDKRNTNVPKGVVPLAIGVTLFGVITCSSSNTGAALNPARDFAPRVYSYIIGYKDVFKYCDHFWWVPIVACHLGAVIGALVYLLAIELHHPTGQHEDEDKAVLDVDADSAAAARSRRGHRGSAGPVRQGAARPYREPAYELSGRENRAYEVDDEPRAYSGRRGDSRSGRDRFADDYM